MVNKGLVLDENSVKKLTTLQLSASDQDSEPGELIYRITKQPSLGHLEHGTSPGSNQSCGSGFQTENNSFTLSVMSVMEIVIIIIPHCLKENLGLN